MVSRKLAVLLYVMAVCLFLLKVCFDHFSESSKGVSMSMGYINSEGQFVPQSSGYYGGNAQRSENFATLGNICLVGGVLSLIAGTACLISSFAGGTTERSYPHEVQWVYEGQPKDGWKCPECGAVNARYIGTCACGAERPPA